MCVFNGTVFFDQQAKQHVYVDSFNFAAGAVYPVDWMYVTCHQRNICTLTIYSMGQVSKPPRFFKYFFFFFFFFFFFLGGGGGGR